MLTAIEIENFKAFGERQRIELRPITMLFGPNSGGKSSVVHALHLAREILVHGNVNVHRPESGGDTLDLGGIHSFIHGRRLGKNPIRLKFEFDIARSELPEFPILDGLNMYVLGHGSDLLDCLKSAAIEFEIQPSSEPFVSRYSVWLNGIETPVVQIRAPLNKPYAVLTDIFWNHPVFHLSASRIKRDVAKQLQDIRKLTVACEARLKLLRSLRNGIVHGLPMPPSVPDELKPLNKKHLSKQIAEVESSIAESARLEKGLLELSNSGNSEDPGVLAGLFSKTGNEPLPGVELQIAQPQNALPRWGMLLGVVAPEGGTNPGGEKSHLATWFEFEYLLTMLVTGPGQVLRDVLEKFRYVGPLRTLPPRGWRPPLLNSVSGWSSGISAWQLLRERENEPLLEAVNRWFSAKDCFDTEYSLERVPFRELPVNWTESLARGVSQGDDPTVSDGLLDDIQNAPIRHRIDLHYRDRRLDLQDVGVGISQVLPVLVAVLDRAAPVVGAEQPDLHLHPKQQAALGDLFVEALHDVDPPSPHDSRSPEHPSNKRLLLIETHSEYLILRIMRRIRETAAGVASPKRTIDRSQLSILHVHHEDGYSRVLPMRLDKDGDLLQPWPDTFFDQDSMERFGKDEQF